MKNKKNIILICNDLITVFKRYADTLEAYFKNDAMKENHNFLYNEYLFLDKDIKNIVSKYTK